MLNKMGLVSIFFTNSCGLAISVKLRKLDIANSVYHNTVLTFMNNVCFKSNLGNRTVEALVVIIVGYTNIQQSTIY